MHLNTGPNHSLSQSIQVLYFSSIRIPLSQMPLDLPIIQKVYDLIKWYVPILNKLPRSHHYLLGNRMITGLYDILDALLTARYAKDKLPQLQTVNSKLDILRYQTRLLLDFNLISDQRYQYASQLINTIGQDLGGWIKHQHHYQPQRT